jgi:hypothetical protein
VLGPRVVLHQLADQPALGMEDGQAAADLGREVEQVQLQAQPAVVAPLRLLQPVQVVGQGLLGLPGGAVDALQLLAGLVAAPVRASDPQQLECRDGGGGGNVRPPAEVDEAVVGVHRDGRAGALRLVGGLDDLALVGLVGEQAQGLLAGQLPAPEGLALGDDLAHARLDALQVLGRERLGHVEVVVEAVLGRRPDGELGPRYRSVTAWASTWAAEWRSTARPCSLAAGRGTRVASRSRARPRSQGSPSTSAATAPVVSSSSAGVVPAVTRRTEPSGSLIWNSGTRASWKRTFS